MKSAGVAEVGTRRSDIVPGSSHPSVARRLLVAVITRYGSLVLLAAMIVTFSLASSQFLTVRNFQNVLVVQSVVSCMAFAAIIPLIIGEFDLSLGYLIGFLAMIGAYLGGAGFGAPVVIPAMLVLGVVVGVVNGLLTVRLHISSFIATLGTGILLSGMTLGISGGQVLFSGIPRLITQIGQGSIFGLGPAVWLTILLALILFFVLEHTPFGRKLYAIGGSERVAFLAGVPVGALKVASFAISGFLVGIGAMFALGQSGAANAGFGPELLLPAYAASFLSVITYRPGYYNIPGIVVAILLLAVGFNGLNLLGAPFWAQPIFNGAVLLIAVITARAESRHIRK
ncbi:MAG TPA: ABC transporter permease [Bauldia sp.]|nr:ABC transporter permease [Bauldia sp.]